MANEKVNLESLNQATRESFDANELAKTITNTILEASKKCNLKKRRQNKKTKTKPWFDEVCSDIKQRMNDLGKKLRCDRGNNDLRNEIFELKKRLKKTVRKKKRQHKTNILKEIEHCTVTDQKKYWKLLGQLQQKGVNTTQYISPRNLSDHYRSLLNSIRNLNIPPTLRKMAS